MNEQERYEAFLEEHASLEEGASYPLVEVVRVLSCRVNVGRGLVKLGLKRKRVDRLLSRKQTLSMELVSSVQELLSDLEVFAFERDEQARQRVMAAVEQLYPSVEPAEVSVNIRGPAWLDPHLWVPKGGRVKTRQARWLLQNLDGLAVGGEVLEVLCDPVIRKGRVPPKRESDAVRHRRLFSRWFEGIRVDEEGLFSLTPEALAMEMCSGLSGRVVDGTCGIGALAIAAARQPLVETVFAVDIVPARIEMARHNARIYQQEKTIGFRVGDVRELLQEEQADWLLLDPPWGGTDYDRGRIGVSDIPFPLESVIQSFEGAIRIKLPRSFLVSELGPDWTCRPAVDDRGILKFLILERGAL